MLKKVSKNTVAAQVIEQISALIRSGSIKPGDKLPSEREMAEQLGVSRPPLREAIRVLEYAGIVETRYGDGIYVKNAEMPLESNPVFSRLLHQYSLKEMIEMRKVVELAAVRFAAERATDEDIETLRGIQRRTEDAVGDMEAFVECDFLFHSSIAEATGNSMLFRTVQTMRKMMGQFNRELLSSEDYRLGVCRQHAAILACIARRESAKAAAALEKHLDNVVNMAMHQSRQADADEAAATAAPGKRRGLRR